MFSHEVYYSCKHEVVAERFVEGCAVVVVIWILLWMVRSLGFAKCVADCSYHANLCSRQLSFFIIKWNKPCYAHDGDNIAIIQRFNDFLSLMFFKGALMNDPEGLLRSQGENTRSALRLEFSSVGEVAGMKAVIQALVAEAIRVEKAGLKVEQAEPPEYPEELIAAMEQDPELHEAFEELTPGRQRSYLLHLSAAKQSATRVNRIAKARDKILSGKGFNEY